jgi:AcrR family transcriptional regulator
MQSNTGTISPHRDRTGRRGPTEDERRNQILDAATACFRNYGYTKTAVADLAKAIGLSPAYIYKLFKSKQAIGEAVCRLTLGGMADELREIARGPKLAATRLRLIYQTVARRGAELRYNDSRLHGLAVIACTEKWQPIRDHRAALLEIIRQLMAEGRESGEFETKAPVTETSLAIMHTLELFSSPLLLEHNIDDLEGKAICVVNLVLRGLAP